MAATALAPIVKTAFYRAFRTGRRECWGAKTTDGKWLFEREESAGTPWIVIHAETRHAIHLTGTLRGCRWFVAAGHADTQLALMQAHERGEHNENRDPACGRC